MILVPRLQRISIFLYLFLVTITPTPLPTDEHVFVPLRTSIRLTQSILNWNCAIKASLCAGSELGSHRWSATSLISVTSPNVACESPRHRQTDRPTGGRYQPLSSACYRVKLLYKSSRLLGASDQATRQGRTGTYTMLQLSLSTRPPLTLLHGFTGCLAIL